MSCKSFEIVSVHEIMFACQPMLVIIHPETTRLWDIATDLYMSYKGKLKFEILMIALMSPGETGSSSNLCGSLNIHPADDYVAACPNSSLYASSTFSDPEMKKTSLSDAEDDRCTILSRDNDFKTETPATPTYQLDIYEGTREQNITYANIALDEYNNKNHTEYVLAEDKPLASNAFVSYMGYMIHCSFHAAEGSSSNPFFAELKAVDESKKVVTACKILEGETRDSCNHGCQYVIHPVDGYLAGCPKSDPPSLPDPEIEKSCEIYRTPATPTPSQMDIYEGTREENISYAKIVLDDYNNDYHTEYVLVQDKPLASNAFLSHRGYMIHCSFHAAEGSSSNLFFAELIVVGKSKTAVLTCRILEHKFAPHEPLNSETRDSCNHCCGRYVIHPVDGYLAGRPKIGSPHHSQIKR